MWVGSLLVLWFVVIVVLFLLIWLFSGIGWWRGFFVVIVLEFAWFGVYLWCFGRVLVSTSLLVFEFVCGCFGCFGVL